MNDWQPIETAPKDGTIILLAAEHHPTVAGWFDQRRGPFPWAFVDDITPVLCGCDDCGDGRAEVNGYPLLMPTHWMPLPEPPR